MIWSSSFEKNFVQKWRISFFRSYFNSKYSIGDENEDEDDENTDENSDAESDAVDHPKSNFDQICDENSDEDDATDETEKLPPLTMALEKAGKVLSSGKSFRKTLFSLKNKDAVFLEGSKLLYKIWPPKWFFQTTSFISFESLGM